MSRGGRRYNHVLVGTSGQLRSGTPYKRNSDVVRQLPLARASVATL